MSRWEEPYAYRRVIRAGDRVLTAGTTAPGPTAEEQARAAFGIALDALATEGATAADVVRTRMYITDRSDADAVGKVHGAIFADVRPVATMVVVAGLIDPSLLVEVEVEASVPSVPSAPLTSSASSTPLTSSTPLAPSTSSAPSAPSTSEVVS